jgi:ACR3 family arsenite transporter
MMYPIMCKVKYETLHLVMQKRDIWIQIGFSIIVNWIVAPLLMASLPPYLIRLTQIVLTTHSLL